MIKIGTFTRKNIKDIMKNQLPGKVLSYLVKTGEIAQKEKTRAYLVGGVVRDLLLEVENLDLDIVVEKDGLNLAKKFASKFAGSITIHKRFYTACVSLKDGIKVDFATARREFYEHPGALPRVQKSNINDDLARRDFSINAMAVRLNPGEFGNLIDFCGGLDDLRNKKIRILHHRSFIEDPTRIFRAIRFEQRYQFSLDSNTEMLLLEAIKADIQKAISYQRLKDELILIFNELRPLPAIERMSRLGLLKYIYPKIRLTSTIYSHLHKVEDTCFLFTLPLLGEVLEYWLVYLMILIEDLTKKERAHLQAKFKFNKQEANKIIKARDLSNNLIKILKKRKLPQSILYRELKKAPNEVILLSMIKTQSKLAKRRVFNYLNNLQKTHIYLTGRDLIEMGYKPGPRFQNIMGTLLASKLDGKITSIEDEKKFVIDNFPRE